MSERTVIVAETVDQARHALRARPSLRPRDTVLIGTARGREMCRGLLTRWDCIVWIPGWERGRDAAEVAYSLGISAITARKP